MNEQPLANELIASALKLPVPDRVAIVNAMLESIDDASEQLPEGQLNQAWSDEISLRLHGLESGEAEPVTSSELWKQLGGKPNA